MLVVKGVPARVCMNCSEEYVDEVTTRALLETAEAAVHWLQRKVDRPKVSHAVH
jgi:hypothetical protein